MQRRGITLAAGQAQPLVRHGSVAQRGRWAGRVQAAEDGPDELANLPEPDTARGAIALGLKLTDAKQWERAQQYFERALELPGTGTKRFRDKPPGISNGEKVSILYNIACCQSQLGEADNIQNGLIALAGCLEAGECSRLPTCSCRVPSAMLPSLFPPQTTLPALRALLQATMTSARCALTPTLPTSERVTSLTGS